MVKERAKAKFDETIEIAMNLGVDPKHADQMVRGVVTAAERHRPHRARRRVRTRRQGRRGQGRRRRRRRRRGPGREGQCGEIDFDRCIATPDMMGLVGRLGKVLGPRGLMPNPRVGTVTMDVATAVKGAKGGSVEFRVEKAGIVQAGVGKASFSADKLVENIKAFADAVNKAKPAGAKGHYINRVADLLDHGAGREGRHGKPRRERRPDVAGGTERKVFIRARHCGPGFFVRRLRGIGTRAPAVIPPPASRQLAIAGTSARTSMMVVRRMSRTWVLDWNGVARCSVQRLSQMTRSPSRHLWA